jgi:hypothetical protein
MESEKIEDVKSVVIEEMKQHLGTLREHAEHFANRAIASKIESGEAFELSEDEIRLLKSYRAFVLRSKPKSVFSWVTPDSNELVLPAEPCLIQDPRLVS